jgi:hypothetical protein
MTDSVYIGGDIFADKVSTESFKITFEPGIDDDGNPIDHEVPFEEHEFKNLLSFVKENFPGWDLDV